MKSQSQFLMVALAISFTMVLALIVALICLRAVDEDFPPEDESSGLDSIFPLATTPETTDEPRDTEPPAPPEGLWFLSNGDGTCRLAGIGSCSDACVVIPEYSPAGERVVEICERAFYGCATVTAVQIPASVNNIGALAFGDCPNLIYISVNPQNRNYRDDDGILYTADLRRLILYPPMRAGASMTLRGVTTEIAEMAFYRCAYLSHVAYLGSAEAWETMEIGSKNYSLTAASKTFLE